MTEFITNCALPLAILFLVIGFVFLVKGADIFVEGSSSIAKKFKVPSIIIGLTIVAMGTSLPEAAVSVTASIANKNALAVSNVIGSNIFNLMMVIGVCAIMTPVAVNKATLKRDFPFSVICAILLLVLGLIGPMSLGHADGVIFLILFAGFIGLMICSALKASKEGNAVASEEIEAAEEIKIMPVWKSLLFIVIGAVGIVIGGDVVVDSASNIAAKFGMSQTLIGLTIVAVGTSLPELVTSIVAARKNEVDMALGNAIGSNVFNILFVLGVAGAISPMAFLTENVIDIVILLVFSLICSALKASKEGNAVASEEIEAAEEIKIMPVWKSLLFIVIGAVGIVIGGDVVVDSASNIAAKFGMSQTLIGLTIVAVGTSLPELVTSIVAARKNEVDMALGNAIGSNVFNILFVLGVAGAISPMAFLTENVIDIVILLVFSLIVWLFAWTKKEIKRGEGLIMVLLYVLYVVYICMR